MIEKGIDPRQILLFTFTRKGAEEIKQRVINYIGEQGSLITVGTYHSFCMRFLRKYINYLEGYTTGFSIYDEKDSLDVLKECAALEKHKKQVKDCKHYISLWKEKMLTPEKTKSLASLETTKYDQELLTVYSQAYEEYQKKLKQRNAFDFDDLIYYTIRIISDYPEAREKVNKRYQFIVADECQDSSPRDLELIRLLGGDKKNICLIGDDSQSIYSFRGADLPSVFNFVETYGFKQYNLEQNYRSTKTIVNAANSVIKKNERQFQKTSFSENSLGGKIVFFQEKEPQDENRRIIQVIKLLTEKMNYNYDDIAILFRNRNISKPLELELIRNEIPHKIINGFEFFDRIEIRYLIDFIRLLYNPRDLVSFNRVTEMFNLFLGPQSIKKIRDVQESFNLQSCVESGITEEESLTLANICDFYAKNVTLKQKRQRENFAKFLEILTQLEFDCTDKTPSEVIDIILESVDYEDKLEKLNGSIEGRKENIDIFKNYASQYCTLEDFIQDFVLKGTEKEEDAEENAVQMMTIHASKGLEFKIVIIIGANNGIIPAKHAEGNPAQMEEERRIFYVAITRAKEQVIITASKKRWVFGAPEWSTVSRFVNEIDSNYIKKQISNF